MRRWNGQARFSPRFLDVSEQNADEIMFRDVITCGSTSFRRRACFGQTPFGARHFARAF